MSIYLLIFVNQWLRELWKKKFPTWFQTDIVLLLIFSVFEFFSVFCPTSDFSPEWRLIVSKDDPVSKCKLPCVCSEFLNFYTGPHLAFSNISTLDLFYACIVFKKILWNVFDFLKLILSSAFLCKIVFCNRTIKSIFLVYQWPYFYLTFIVF